mmetsp:Transcript_44360/g.73930  ORF Transcript_44360/g.73930 Transcript_44360/m.73930 type:complete len:290 (-) Transcript_44360:874-1743(-)
MLLFRGLEHWEGDDVADGGGVGEQHDEAVHAEAHPARRGQPVLQRRQEVLVHLDIVACIILAFLASARRCVVHHLRFQAFALLDGIRELTEGVGELAAVDEELEAVRNARHRRMRLGQRRDLDRVLENKRRLHQLRLAQLLEHFIEHVAHARTLGDFVGTDACGRRRRPRLYHVSKRQEVHPCGFLHEFAHGDAAEGGGEVDLRPLVLHLHGPAHLLGASDDHVLGEGEHVVDVSVGLIHFHASELGVVPRADALVAEDATQLKNLLEPPDHEPLEVQLGGNAHDHRAV